MHGVTHGARLGSQRCGRCDLFVLPNELKVVLPVNPWVFRLPIRALTVSFVWPRRANEGECFGNLCMRESNTAQPLGIPSRPNRPHGIMQS
jgi:hypothetical protein